MKEETNQIKNLWPERDASRATTVNPPLYRGSTVLFDSYADMIAVNEHRYEGITYGTDRLPTQRQFEEALRTMEGAALTRILPSGISAIQMTLMAFLRAGDHMLICDNAYSPGQRFCRKILNRYGISHTLIPPTTGADVEQYIRPETKLILLESPGSITFELQDIPAITAQAQGRGIVTVLDATWGTPLYLKPFALGVDVSIHSVTKYIAGYSDVLAGSVSVNEKYAPVFDAFYREMELYTPAQECYLALRGLNTLATRLRQHEKSALRIAAWLAGHPLVADVLHPALPQHPEHHIWKRDFSGAAGLFGFTFKEDYSPEQLTPFIDTLQLFGLGFSWGGYKSLLTAARIRRETPCRYSNKTIIRLNIGLEDPDDLQNDLEYGLARLTDKQQ